MSDVATEMENICLLEQLTIPNGRHLGCPFMDSN